MFKGEREEQFEKEKEEADRAVEEKKR